ncbi:hypothetical protein RUND412_011078 [Rhizina undulata]
MIKVANHFLSSLYNPPKINRTQNQQQRPPFPELITSSFLTTFLLHDITTREIIFDPDTVHETPTLFTLQCVAERGYVKPKHLVNEPFQRFIMMLCLKQYDITTNMPWKRCGPSLRTRQEMWNVEGPTWKEAGKPRVSAAGECGKRKYECKKGWEKLPTIFESDDALKQEEEEERRGRF